MNTLCHIISVGEMSCHRSSGVRAGLALTPRPEHVARRLGKRQAHTSRNVETAALLAASRAPFFVAPFSRATCKAYRPYYFHQSGHCVSPPLGGQVSSAWEVPTLSQNIITLKWTNRGRFPISMCVERLLDHGNRICCHHGNRICC